MCYPLHYSCWRCVVIGGALAVSFGYAGRPPRFNRRNNGRCKNAPLLIVE